MEITFQFVPLTLHEDQRGTLIAFEQPNPLPFDPKRAFVIKDVAKEELRAEHAVSCDEFLVLLTGRCRITLRTKTKQDVFDLDDPHRGLFVPAGIWLKLDRFEQDTFLLVFASARYGETQYFDEPQV